MAQENLTGHIVKSYIQPSATDNVEKKHTRVFTTASKGFRIRRGRTIIIRRCKDIMRHLWQTNHRRTVTQGDLDQAIFFCAGGDYRTIRRYRGFYLPKAMRSVPGYLQRLRYIERVGFKEGQLWFLLNHETLPYYSKQVNFGAPSGANNDRLHSQAENVCVQGRAESQRQVTSPHNTIKQQQHNTHTNRSSESNRSKEIIKSLNKTADFNKNMSKLSVEELRILKAAEGPQS